MRVYTSSSAPTPSSNFFIIYKFCSISKLVTEWCNQVSKKGAHHTGMNGIQEQRMIDVHEVSETGEIDVHGGIAPGKWKNDAWWQVRGEV
jgi:hypothetical protein